MNEQSSSSTPKKTCIQLIRKERIWAPVMKALRQTLKDLNNLVVFHLKRILSVLMMTPED